MKYLAAYPLLTLSGKKDISTFLFTQTSTISNPSSDPSALKPPTMTSTAASTVSRANPSTSSLLRVPRRSDPLVPLPLPLLARRKPLKNNNPRRRKKLRNPLPLPLLSPRKRWTWATCSADYGYPYLNLPFLSFKHRTERIVVYHPSNQRITSLHIYKTNTKAKSKMQLHT